MLGLGIALATPGCGRFGFELLGSDRDGTRPSAEGDSQGATGEDSDAGQPGPGPDGGPIEPDVDGGSGSGFVDGGADAANASDDAGAADEDAAIPGPMLEPLPTNVDCSKINGLVACDDFSGSQSGVAVDDVSYNGGTATVIEFLTATTSGDMQGARVESRFNALNSGAVYLRFSAFVPSYYAIDGINLASLGDLDSGTDFGFDLNLVRNGQVEIKTSGDDQVTSAGAFMLPRDQWICVMVKLESIDDSTGSAKVLINDNEIISASNVDTHPPSGITGASAGLDWTFDGQGPATLFVDNFVVARQHPGDCP